MSMESPIIKKWNRWFDVIYNDVVTLHYYRMIYRDVGSMVGANPAIQKPSSFYDLLGRGYVTMAAIMIRRQVDNGKDCISLVRLLSDISNHPEEISRRRFHKFYESHGFSEAQIDGDFEAAGVEAGRDFVDPERVDSDVKELKQVTASLRKYTNKTVAHIDVRQQMTSVPTFGDLDDSIDALARLCGKYSILLRGEGIAFFEPVIQYDWQAVFRVAWIVDEPGVQAQRREPHVS